MKKNEKLGNEILDNYKTSYKITSIPNDYLQSQYDLHSFKMKDTLNTVEKIMLFLPILFLTASFIPISFGEFIADSPREQLESGVAPEGIVCNEDRTLVIRTNGDPACVTETTAQKLERRGLIQTVSKLSDKTNNDTKQMVKQIPLSEEIQKIPFETNSSNNSVSSHSSSGGVPDPNFTLDIPSVILVGETVAIDYTIDWNDENGDPLHELLFERGSLSDVVIKHELFLPDEFEVVSDDFVLRGALGGSVTDHMMGKYRGGDIPYDNSKVIMGSIKIKLLEPMMFEHDDFYIGIYRVDGGHHLQVLSAGDIGVEIIPISDPSSDGIWDHSRIRDRYVDMYGFDEQIQQWTGSGKTFGITPNGFPLLPSSDESTTLLQSFENQEPSYMPEEGWESFAEFLRQMEETDGFDVTKEWLMSENMSEEFVDDFFVAYPEFLIHDTNFRFSFLPAAQAATQTFFAFEHYKVDGYERFEKGGNNVIICAYGTNEKIDLMRYY